MMVAAFKCFVLVRCAESSLIILQVCRANICSLIVVVKMVELEMI